jgi:hypothetical protein
MVVQNGQTRIIPPTRGTLSIKPFVFIDSFYGNLQTGQQGQRPPCTRLQMPGLTSGVSVSVPKLALQRYAYQL